MITLTNFKCSAVDSGVRLSCETTIDGENELVYFDIEGPEEKLAKIAPDPSPFLIGMLIAAMERGEDLHIDGNVPGTFLHHINAFLVPFLIACWPARHSIKVTATANEEWPSKPKEVLGAMTGLSCGVDSLYTLMEYTGKDVPAAYRLKSFAVFDVGAFNEINDELSAARFKQTRERAAIIVNEIGCDFYTVRSNLRQRQSDPFRRVATMVNCACALALADICETYLPASSETYEDIKVSDQLGRRRRSIDNLDPILLPLISNSRLEIFSSGGGTNRFRKTLALLDRSAYLDKLTTCTRINPFVNGGKNCGTCGKCGQFLLIAEAKNALEKFSGNFDLAAYHRRKWRICQRLISRCWESDNQAIVRESVKFAQENGVKIPIFAYIASYSVCFMHRIAPRYF